MPRPGWKKPESDGTLVVVIERTASACSRLIEGRAAMTASTTSRSAAKEV